MLLAILLAPYDQRVSAFVTLTHPLYSLAQIIVGPSLLYKVVDRPRHSRLTALSISRLSVTTLRLVVERTKRPGPLP